MLLLLLLIAPVVHSTSHTCLAGQYYDETDEVCRLCQEGYFGALPGMTSAECSGPCQQGHFCPAGSTSVTERECGGPQYFCPSQSSAPTSVLDGYYTTITSTNEREGLDAEASIAMRTWVYQEPHEGGVQLG